MTREKTLVMISGTARSGSTVLDLMLGSGPDAFSCGEVFAHFRPYRTHHRELNCGCGQDPCPAWAGLVDVPESEFHAWLLNRYGYETVVDSSKELTWLIDAQKWASAHRYRIANVVIWKDPIDLAYSFWKRKQDPTSMLVKQFLTYHARFFSLNLPFVAINHHDLVSSPEVKLHELCAAIDVPYSQEMLAFTEHIHHYLFGSDGTRKQMRDRRTSEVTSVSTVRAYEPVAQELASGILCDQQIVQTVQMLRINDVGSAKDCISRVPAATCGRPAWYYLRRMGFMCLRLMTFR